MLSMIENALALKQQSQSLRDRADACWRMIMGSEPPVKGTLNQVQTMYYEMFGV
jgi:hypothetical protein